MTSTAPKRRKAKSPKRPKKTREPSVPLAPDIPHWLPTGQHWDDLSPNIRQAVPQILAPAYRRFVLEAPGELERSVGLTLVHLMWLELCDQIQLAAVVGDPSGLDALLKNPEDMIDRHLRLAAVKCQTAELLMKLRVVTEALQRPPTPPIPALAPPEESTPQSAYIIQTSVVDTKDSLTKEPEIGKSPP